MTDLDDARAGAFAAERPHLLAVAFRMLGSDADAQDVVQEAWGRYTRASVDDIANLQAWLTTVVTRLCLDVLRRTREQPSPADDLEVDREVASPEDVAVLAAELTDAFVVVLDRLSPEQRVALVLHDVFGTPFEEVARVLATTPGSAKKLASRARGRLRGDLRHRSRSQGDDREAGRVVRAFLVAAREGDVDALVAILHPGITRTADPQALPPGAPQRAVGIAAVVAETRALQGNARAAELASIDGRPGIVLLADDVVVTALVVRVDEGRVRHYDVVADPARLGRLRIEGPRR